MRLRIASDLHLESFAVALPDVACDVVVLAGDIHEGAEGVVWARAAFAGPVVYVAGNHEFYGHDVSALDLTVAARGTNVRVLERAAWVHRGVRFLGCTLWTGFDLLEDPDAALPEVRRRMSDYKRIRFGDRRFRPEDAARLHAGARRWLEGALDEPFAGPTVVVTHHAPSADSLPDRYLDDPRALAYASRLEDLVARSGVALWIHGHVHTRCDYLIDSTRVLSNPRGTCSESIAEFDPGLTVDVPGP